LEAHLLSNFGRDNCFALCYWTNQELHNQVLVHQWLVRQLVLLTPKDGQAAVELGPGVAKKARQLQFLRPSPGDAGQV
jgi:hypothetical protein